MGPRDDGLEVSSCTPKDSPTHLEQSKSDGRPQTRHALTRR